MELPRSFGFVLLDFKLVNTAVRDVLPFDPDASDLPVAKPVTLRTTGHLVGMEKVIGDIAQVSIQIAFLHNTTASQNFVIFSVLVGMIHGTLALITVIRECVQDEWDLQKSGVHLGTALMPGTQLSHGSFSANTNSKGTGALDKLRPTETTRLNSRPDSPSSPVELSSKNGSCTRAQQIG